MTISNAGRATASTSQRRLLAMLANRYRAAGGRSIPASGKPSIWQTECGGFHDGQKWL
jgi:hypothetical protein